MKRVVIVVAALLLGSMSAWAEENVTARLFKNPNCKCCDAYADYLRTNGFDVTVVEHRSMSLIKRKYGIREDLKGCHTTVIEDYVVEGHVPVAALRRLITERPAIKGVSLPGMPAGSPGMSGTKEAPFEILSITSHDGPPPVFTTE